MALYAFDGTWNEDEETPSKDSNVVRFRDAYVGRTNYVEGVGTRFRFLRRVIGGIFGAGGRTRTYEMYQALAENWKAGDHDIDIVGFSRGAALAVNFANVINEKGVRTADGATTIPNVRFLGVWDVVGSFGIPIDVGELHFQELNVGWNLKVPGNAASCAHAIALDERRQTFAITRLCEDGAPDSVEELWFRGVHSDIGGGNENVGRSNIALSWMFERASAAGVGIRPNSIKKARLASDPDAPISENLDPKKDPRRVVEDGDDYHPTARSSELDVGEERTFTVYSARKSNWSGVRMKAGHHYCFEIPAGDTWKDADITCGPEGWKTKDLPFFKESVLKLAEPWRRYPEADWFEMIGAVGDEEELFRIGAGGAERTFTPSMDGDFAAFANDLPSKYSNNSGDIELAVRRVAVPAQPIEARGISS